MPTYTDNATLTTFRSRNPLTPRNRRWFWRLTHQNGNELARSSEGYFDRSEAARVGVKVCGGQYHVTYGDTPA